MPTSATTKKVTVDYSITPQRAIDDTGANKWVINQELLNSLVPKNNVQDIQELEVELFKIGKYVTTTELAAEYESRGLTPVDVYTLAKLNADRDLSKEYIATQWKDDKGFCCAYFISGFDGRFVHVCRRDYGWYGYWSFAGLRKVNAGCSVSLKLPSESSELCPHCKSNMQTVKLILPKAVYEDLKNGGYDLGKYLQ